MIYFNGVKWFLCLDSGSKFDDGASFAHFSKVFALVIRKKWQQNINYGSSSFGDPLVLGDSNSTSTNVYTSSVSSKGKQEFP